MTTENFGIWTQSKKTDLTITSSLNIPKINSNMLDNVRRKAGEVAYDVVTKRTWECVEDVGGLLLWRPIAGGGGGSGSVKDFSLIKFNNQIIPSGTETTLTSFVAALPYFDSTGQWDSTTGVYTATEVQTLILSVNVTWAPGVTNQGKRSIKIYHKPAASPQVLIKDSTTQASASMDYATTQIATVGVTLAVGDQVYVKAFQNSGFDIPIDNTGTLSGHRTLL